MRVLAFFLFSNTCTVNSVVRLFCFSEKPVFLFAKVLENILQSGNIVHSVYTTEKYDNLFKASLHYRVMQILHVYPML